VASKEAAIKNNLNDRARKVGQFDELSTQDIDALIAFYDFTCLNPACRKKPAKSVDHVIALERGGTNKLENLQLLCVKCNKAKGAKDTDYRNGKIFTRSDERSKHNWDEIQFEYVTGYVSLRYLAQKFGVAFSHISLVSERDEWTRLRRIHRDKIGTLATQEIAKQTAQMLAEKELSARGLLFDVIAEAVDAWRSKPNPSTRELAELLKLGLVAQGEVTERTNLNVSERMDTDEIHARINRLFDTGEEGRTYTPLGPDGAEPSAGYSD